MGSKPKIIKAGDIAGILARRFRSKDKINGYIGSNAATPKTSVRKLTEAIEAKSPRLPYIRMIHTLLEPPVPYIKPGLEDRVRCYSIFSGRGVREAANQGRAYYLPCTLANIDGLLEESKYTPDFAVIKVSRNEHTGEYSLGLSVEAEHMAIDKARIVFAELDPSMPFTCGNSLIDADSIDYMVVDDVEPVKPHDVPDYNNLSPAHRRIGELTTRLIKNGDTIQVGIGNTADAVISTIRNAGFRDLGVHTELYSDGLMLLEKAGIVNNRRKKLDTRRSVTSLIMGSRQLYDYVDYRLSLHMEKCSYTNGMEYIRANAPFVSVNTAMGVDWFGNVWADFVEPGRYYSGIGGQPDFIRALNREKIGTPIIVITTIAGNGKSKIVKSSPKGISTTAAYYDGAVVITEYGIADLRYQTLGTKALAMAHIAHPRFRERFKKMIYNDRLITKPYGFNPEIVPDCVTMYEGDIKLDGE